MGSIGREYPPPMQITVGTSLCTRHRTTCEKMKSYGTCAHMWCTRSSAQVIALQQEHTSRQLNRISLFRSCKPFLDRLSLQSGMPIESYTSASQLQQQCLREA